MKFLLLLLIIYNQICLPQNSEWKVFNEINNRIIGNGMTSIYKDGQNLWLGDGWYFARYDSCIRNANIFNVENSKVNWFHTEKNAIIKDQIGNIWIGISNTGLIKFDGIDWTVYNTDNSELLNNNVLSLAEDIDGALWIGMEYGKIAKYKSGIWTNYDLFQLGIGYYHVNSIAIDKFGNKWFGTGAISFSFGVPYFSGDHLIKFNDSTWTKYIHDMTYYSNGFVKSVKTDILGNVWVSSCRSIAKFNNGTWTDIDISDYFQSGDQYLVPIAIDSSNDIWIGTASKILRFHESGITEIPLTVNSINTIYIDNNDNKWLSTSNGLAKYDNSNINFLQITNGMNGAEKVSADKKGNIWLWDRLKDLTRFNGNVWRRFNPNNSGLPNSLINSLIFDSSDNMWVAASRYLTKYENDEFITLLDIGIDSLSRLDREICSITIDHNDVKWLATSIGLGKLVGSDLNFYNTSNSNIPFDQLDHVVVDNLSNVWISGYGYGLAKFDGINWESYNSSNSGLPSDYIISLCIDKNGNLFIGTLYGLSYYHNLDWSNYDSIIAHSIIVDSLNVTWIASESGLHKFDGVNWTAYNTANSGIPSNYVSSISIDKNNNKWMYCPYSDGIYGDLVIFNEDGISSSIEIPSLAIPSEIELYQNYPNPFNPSTVISFQLPISGNVTLKVYDILGNEVATLVNEEKTAGNYKVEFNGEKYSSGVYFYTMRAGNFIETKKLILLK